MSSLIHVYCPDIQHDTGTLGDKVAHVLVIFGSRVGDCSSDGCGHPSKRFFDHCVDVWKLRFVSHGGKTIRADDEVDLILSFLLDFWETGHSLNKGDQCRRRGVRSSFEKSSLIRSFQEMVIP